MPYPSDLTPEQFALVEDLFDVGNYGSARKHSIHALLNAVFYVVKTGCQWKYLPSDFPTYSTVYSFFRRSRDRGIWDKMLKRLVEVRRVQQGRHPNPTYALIDSQSVKTTGASEDRGFDGGKKCKGA
jgi:putative transposase